MANMSMWKKLASDWPFWLVLLTGAVLRLLFLDQMELWWDEFVTLGRSLPAIPDLLTGLMYQSPSPVSTDCSPPLHHLLVHAVLGLGHGGNIIRLPSVVFGLIALACVMRLAERMLGRRVGILAGTFCALSLFHIYYSRDLRWYSVYYGCSLAGLYALYRAVTDDRRGWWLAFGLASALALYASYVAAPALAGEMLFIAGLCCVRWFGGRRAEARRLAWHALTALALALVLYAPWIPGQYYAYNSFYGKGTTNPFLVSQFLGNIKFFLEYFYQGQFDKLLFALPLVLVGFGWALAGKRRLGPLLLLAWGVPPAAAAYLVKTEFSVSPKYVISLFFLLTFGLAFGAEAVARFLSRPLPRAKGLVEWSIALGLVLGVGASNFHYGEFYQGKMYSDKAILRELALAKNNIDILLYDNERNYSFVGDWYLGNFFKRPTGVFQRDYKRFYLVSQIPDATPWAVTHRKTKNNTVFAGGLLNRAPLLVHPGADHVFRYADDYHDFTLFKDAWRTENMTVSDNAGLVPADMTRPGLAVYAFRIPAGLTCRQVLVHVAGTVLKRNVFFPNGAFEVLVGSDPDHLTRLGHLDALSPPGPASTASDFKGLYGISGTWEIPAGDLAGGTFFVALSGFFGTREGYMKITAMDVTATCEGDVDAAAAARTEFDHVLANLSERERPRIGDRSTPGRLVAFSLDDALFPPDTANGLGSARDRDRFLATHPGLPVVHTIAGPSGQPAVVFYDPWLITPYLTLPAATRQAVDAGSPVVGYQTPGSLQPALARFAGVPLPLSCGSPEGAVATYAGLGDSSVIVREAFDEAHMNPQNFYSLRDVRLLGNGGALTCLGQRPCQATYRLASLYPATRLVLTTYPHLYCDPGRENFVRLSVAADGGPFREVYTLRSDGSRQWLGGGAHPNVDVVPFGQGAKETLIRLEMRNDGCQWSSNPEAPMTFEWFLDTRGMPPMPQGTGELANIAPDGVPASLSFLHEPPDAFERLRPGLAVTPFLRFLFR